jgi:hypothetical protein
VTPKAGPAQEKELDFERRSIFKLLPRKTFSKVLLMLALLAVIVFLQRRSGSIAKNLAETQAPPLPAGAPSERQIPTVRMAPLPPPKVAPRGAETSR